jgi:hypothetical protein
LGKSQPKKQVCDITGNTYHCHLNRYSTRFSEGKVQNKSGFPGDPRGIEREEFKELEEHPYRSRTKMDLRLEERVFGIFKWFLRLCTCKIV